MSVVDTSEHRALHSKDEFGRDPTIESYVRQSFKFYLTHLNNHYGRDENLHSFFDVGADYGYAMELANGSERFTFVTGLEPYPAKDMKPLASPIRKETIEAYLNSFRMRMGGSNPVNDRHWFMNHVLEHFINPLDVLIAAYERTSMRTAFIAVPNALLAEDEFVYAPGHTHAFTPKWFTELLPRFVPIEKQIQADICFRKNYIECWNFIVFDRKG